MLRARESQLKKPRELRGINSFLMKPNRLNAQAVLVGHHADDQVETVLMHLLRGSGMSGLAGMRMVLLPNPWSETIPLVRPLLFTWRAEIEEYCRSQRLASGRRMNPTQTRNTSEIASATT